METTVRLEKMLKYVYKTNSDVTVQQLMLLLHIANNEGTSQVEASQALEMPEPTVSRIIAKFGRRKIRTKLRDGSIQIKEGKALLTKGVDDDYDIRRNVIKLTRKGWAFIQNLEEILE